MDHMMCFDNEGYRHLLTGYFEIEKIKFKDFEQMFYERAILNIRKFSQIRVNIWGVIWWKDGDRENARKQLMKEQRKLNNEGDVLKYCEELINGNMDLDKPLWEFHVFEDYSKDTSMVIARFHHWFTDGIGFISLMSWLNDNKYSIKNTKSIPKLSIFQSLLLILATPYFLYKFQNDSNKISTDSKAQKVRELATN